MSKSQTNGLVDESFQFAQNEFFGLKAFAKSKISLDQLITIGMLKGNSTSGPVKKMLHAPTLRIYALKEVPIVSRESRFMLKEWIQEWESNLNKNENLVRIQGTFWNTPEGCVSIAMDYNKQGSLQNLLESIGALPEYVIKEVCWNVIKALDFMHQ